LRSRLWPDCDGAGSWCSRLNGGGRTSWIQAITRGYWSVARNLDTWMLSVEANRSVLRMLARGADAVIGGRNDGAVRWQEVAAPNGAAARRSRNLLKLRWSWSSMAARVRGCGRVVLGLRCSMAELRLAGVILNRVAGERHYEMLRERLNPPARRRSWDGYLLSRDCDSGAASWLARS